MKSSKAHDPKVLSLKTLNHQVVAAEYAVRGALAIRAESIRKALLKKSPSSEKLNFDSLIQCNIGNPQQLGQKPLTFFRQVSSLLEWPDLFLDQDRLETARHLFPKDAVQRAKSLLDSCEGNIGAYSHSQGIPQIRQHVADFIQERDGYPSNPDSIFLTAGASQGVQFILQCLVQNPNVGVMIPIPQYPLYTAALTLTNGKPVSYFLDESSGWGLSIDELKRSLASAKNDGVDVRALCVINPGNPTGNCLSLDQMKDVVKFCHDEHLVLLADEVYQANVYVEGKPFHSFKKVSQMLGGKYRDIELISFHSISKGVVGECGRRGGYFECSGIDEKALEQIYKLASIYLCPPVQGQVMVDLMVKPPKNGEESFPLYEQEYTAIYESLKTRAKKLVSAFNEMEGVSCQNADGAMYLFPSISLSKRAAEHAKSLGMLPDAFYCMEMLNSTGVCVVPGSGFGQKEGTWHFRATFLPPENVFDGFIERIQDFHKDFMETYR